MNQDLGLLGAPSQAVALAAACRLAYSRGLVHALAGNASARVPDGFLCTPTGCCLGELCSEDLVHCDPTWVPRGGSRGPSSEWRLHAHIYATGPTITAILHTHSPQATALAVGARDIQPITPEIAHFLGHVPCVPFAEPGTAALGLMAAEAMRAGARALLLERHGAVAWGSDIREAFFQAELLESAAALAARVQGMQREL